jgi:superfamily II DNA or RNA helicase
MLGEGFDLPNLKICALHDAHKSLPIILQFTGRFTRSSRGNDIGDAYIVANIANSEIENNIEELFSQDADWNRLLNIRSAEETQKFIDFNRLMEGFRDFPEISIQNIYPKLSAVVYKTKTPIWTSTIFTKFIKDKYEYYNINEEEHIIILIKKLDEKIAW